MFDLFQTGLLLSASKVYRIDFVNIYNCQTETNCVFSKRSRMRIHNSVHE